MLAGTMIGIEIGAQLIMFLERLGTIGSVVRWVYVGFLALISFMVFYDYYKAVSKKKKGVQEEGDRGTEGITWYKTLHKIKIPPMMHFKMAGFTCSAWLPIMVSLSHGHPGRLPGHRRRPAAHARPGLPHRLPHPHRRGHRPVRGHDLRPVRRVHLHP